MLTDLKCPKGIRLLKSEGAFPMAGFALWVPITKENGRNMEAVLSSLHGGSLSVSKLITLNESHPPPPLLFLFFLLFRKSVHSEGSTFMVTIIFHPQHQETMSMRTWQAVFEISAVACGHSECLIQAVCRETCHKAAYMSSFEHDAFF